jgi:hypothetical protein
VRFKSIIEFYGDFFAKVMSDKKLSGIVLVKKAKMGDLTMVEI